MVQHSDIDHTGITGVGGGGGTGQGLVDFGQVRYTGADITADADGVWEDLGISDITLTASSGDIIEVGVSAIAANTTNITVGLDCHTIVSASPVNSVATGTAVSDSDRGVSAWQLPAAQIGVAGGSVFYTLQAGDISGGTVTLRLRDRPAGTTNRVINAGTVFPIHFWAKNLGPAL